MFLLWLVVVATISWPIAQQIITWHNDEAKNKILQQNKQQKAQMQECKSKINCFNKFELGLSASTSASASHGSRACTAERRSHVCLDRWQTRSRAALQRCITFVEQLWSVLCELCAVTLLTLNTCLYRTIFVAITNASLPFALFARCSRAEIVNPRSVVHFCVPKWSCISQAFILRPIAANGNHESK